ncbi:hypothetical protein L873DRAFT_1434797 [Choiromyces venosus 120613-1]|uniref:Uncharacterized protein n=1 Tax=Choiromyces venosus 120613-1 TaxID=1336337 RepID=A0A3N4JCM0_9PEZI|nr:hypothetical protein L873DRAFT_1434797 [Choiromyces venosus 120613-1]
MKADVNPELGQGKHPTGDLAISSLVQSYHPPLFSNFRSFIQMLQNYRGGATSGKDTTMKWCYCSVTALNTEKLGDVQVPTPRTRLHPHELFFASKRNFPE